MPCGLAKGKLDIPSTIASNARHNDTVLLLICVDDAVVVEPERAENVITNDGTTMRIIAQIGAKPSAWTRQDEIVSDQRAHSALNQRDAQAIEWHEVDGDAEAAVSALDSKDDTSVEEKTNETAEEADPVIAEPSPSTQAQTEKIGTSSIEKIQHHEIDGDKDVDATPVKAMPADEASVEADPIKDIADNDAKAIGESEVSKASPEPTEDKSADNGLSGVVKQPTAKPTVRMRSSSGSGKREAPPKHEGMQRAQFNKQEAHTNKATRSTKPPVIDNKIKGALATSRLSKATELRRQREEEAQRKEAARKDAQEKAENERLAEQRAYQKTLETEAREEERARRAEDRAEEKKIRDEKRQYEAQRREEGRLAIKNASEAKAQALTLADLDKIKAQNQFVDRFNGMADEEQKFSFDPTAPRGPSQTVIYNSRFVDKLSDVTDDMSVSGSLSIKAAKIGGSGRGSFVDSDKFKESDLNFYISVKVINQTLNFKDALIYNPLRSVDQNNFQQVYGDSFISGFLEGGEFNALVSMKILNKAKMTDIKAEAKVAFTAGPIDVTAEANVGIARSNIETNTETTIQVSWCGGGHIKPMEQQWDIKSLMQAAARFPDLVADCPQRTYAILTKYDSLRSFVARRPASYTPLQYENAQIYTNALMDSFMTYKSIYKRLGDQIFNIQGKTLEIVPWTPEDVSTGTATSSGPSTEVAKPSQKNEESGLYPYVEDLSRFEASMKGLSDARKVIRRQMMRIVNEVDLMEKNPKLATDEDHQEPFQSPVAFESRLPVVEIPKRLQQKSDPLTGKRIMAKTQTEEEQKKELDAQEDAANAPSLYAASNDLATDERAALDKLKEENPGIGQHLRVSSAVGTTEKGVPFTNLDFLQPDWEVQSVRVEVARGAITCVEVSYENGLILKKGKSSGGLVKELSSFLPSERVTYASLEYGELPSQGGTRVLAVRLYTNHGRRLLGQAAKNEVGKDGTVTKDGILYEKVKSIYVDAPFQKGTFKGFFGRCDDSDYNGILRLGLVWGDLYKASTAVSTMDNASGSDFDYSAQNDSDEVQALRNDLAQKNRALQDAVSGKKPTTIAEAGIVGQSSQWNQDKADMVETNPVRFATPYVSAPRMISGLTKLDQASAQPIRIRSQHQSVTPTGFEVFTGTFGGAKSYASGIGWMALPENDIHFETGVYETYGLPRLENNQTVINRTYFPRRFDRIPTVVSWIYEVNVGSGWHSLRTIASNINEERFDLGFGTWADRSFDGARVGWLAFSDAGCNSRAKAGAIGVQRAEPWKKGRVTFDGSPFSKKPAVFMALMEFDSGDDKNLRLHGEATDVTTTGFEYGCGTWAGPGDHNMDHSVWVWIAVE